MATEIRRFTATIPAGTPQSAPVSVDMSFPARVVEQIDIRIPPGPMGEVGFALGAAGVRVIPLNAGAWIVGNDEVIEWPLTGLWDSGSWTFTAYNTGRYTHTLEVRFRVSPPGSAVTTSQPLTGLDSSQVVDTVSVAPAVAEALTGAPADLALPTAPDVPVLDLGTVGTAT